MKFLLIAMLAVFVLAACGGNQDEDIAYEDAGYEDPADIEPDAEPDISIDISEDEDQGTMAELLSAYRGLIEVLQLMTTELNMVETDEELAEWREAFESVHTYVGLTFDLLNEVVERMPEAQQDDVITLSSAINILRDGMVALMDELDVGAFGDPDALAAAIENFEMFLLTSDMIVDGI